jgi:hypothetical protein
MSALLPPDQELLNRRNRHPKLKNRMTALLSIAEDAGDEFVKADEAEKRVRKAIRKRGNEVLTDGAESQVTKAEVYLPTGEQWVRCGQNNFTGIAPSVTLT